VARGDIASSEKELVPGFASIEAKPNVLTNSDNAPSIAAVAATSDSTRLPHSSCSADFFTVQTPTDRKHGRVESDAVNNDVQSEKARPETTLACSDSALPTADADRPFVDADARARELLRRLQVMQSAELLPEVHDSQLRNSIAFQLKEVNRALEQLRCHPALEAFHSGSAAAAPCQAARRDVLETSFDLDDEGRRVEATVEFFPDGSASLQWSARNLPVPLPFVLCLVHEIDLLGDLVPFLQVSECLHQFDTNEADRLICMVSKPPIPFVSGIETTAQRFGFDLLDTPWRGFCLMETSPEWTPTYRELPRPKPKSPSARQAEVKTMVALGRPAGLSGELTTSFFTVSGNLKISRWMLPDTLIAYLVKLIGKFIFQKALEKVNTFQSSEHGKRMASSSFYLPLHEKINSFVAAVAETERGVDDGLCSAPKPGTPGGQPQCCGFS
jgi:hypothetical protein